MKPRVSKHITQFINILNKCEDTVKKSEELIRVLNIWRRLLYKQLVDHIMQVLSVLRKSLGFKGSVPAVVLSCSYSERYLISI